MSADSMVDRKQPEIAGGTVKSERMHWTLLRGEFEVEKSVVPKSQILLLGIEGVVARSGKLVGCRSLGL